MYTQGKGESSIVTFVSFIFIVYNFVFVFYLSQIHASAKPIRIFARPAIRIVSVPPLAIPSPTSPPEIRIATAPAIRIATEPVIHSWIAPSPPTWTAIGWPSSRIVLSPSGIVGPLPAIGILTLIGWNSGIPILRLKNTYIYDKIDP